MNEFNINNELPWPGDKDKVFKKGSVRNPTVAFLDNWVKSLGWDSPLPDVYKEAADIIVSYIEEGKLLKNPDFFFFPIAYLYRHSIELYLKSIVYLGIKMDLLREDDRLNKIMTNHALDPLWNKVREILENVWPNGNKDDLKNVERLIKEFHNFDVKSVQIHQS